MSSVKSNKSRGGLSKWFIIYLLNMGQRERKLGNRERTEKDSRVVLEANCFVLFQARFSAILDVARTKERHGVEYVR